MCQRSENVIGIYMLWIWMYSIHGKYELRFSIADESDLKSQSRLIQ